MLSQISISNYTIVSSLEMEFANGMTVITGETGAGKSIMLDALGLCLGDRADTKALRPGAERAEITAGFDLKAIPAAQNWLRERDLLTGEECLLRRVITAEGRSRAYINGSASTLQDCAELGALLIDIHSQHAHQSLLRKATQRALLDAYAGHAELTAAVEQTASDWLRKGRELELLTGANDERSARVQLLRYQVQELDTLAMGADELSTLEREVKLLANAEGILSGAHQALELTDAGESGAKQALQLLSDEAHATTAAKDARELLESAAIQLEEARSSIQQHLDGVEVDPQRLAGVQARLEAIYDVARKHKIMPERLPELHAHLGEELRNLEDGGARIESLTAEMADLAAAYDKLAAKLTKQRKAAAKKLVKNTTAILATLAMEQCQLEIALGPVQGGDPHPHGNEDIEILISTNPGAAPQGLGKIASGGELSRISLAIQVTAASAGTVPSMVFDEVDVGIGGAVAEVVGKLLRELAAKAQVLCVTHLPQVAAQGHQHLKVSKTSSDDAVETNLNRIESDAKVEEIARMLGGVKITKQTLAHAREMLETD
ncbi:MAG: DNA repair protein RecN [Halioglobus sp.]|nr:DNA repair protein RecN [Halioglobus sp.]